MAVNRPSRGDTGSGGGGRGPKRQHRRVCSFCVEKIAYIDYKEISRLRRFVSDRGKILPRRVTGTCARHQRPLTTALARARASALFPYKTAANERARPCPPTRWGGRRRPSDRAGGEGRI